MKPWERAIAEAGPPVESVQQGLASSAYDPGPLMIDQERSRLSEHGVLAIQNLWRDAMAEHHA